LTDDSQSIRICTGWINSGVVKRPVRILTGEQRHNH
jgi:hypothetical protein